MPHSFCGIGALILFSSAFSSSLSQAEVIFSILSTIFEEIVFMLLIESEAVKMSLYLSLKINRFMNLFPNFYLITAPTRPLIGVPSVFFRFQHRGSFRFPQFHRSYVRQKAFLRPSLSDCAYIYSW